MPSLQLSPFSYCKLGSSTTLRGSTKSRCQPIYPLHLFSQLIGSRISRWSIESQCCTLKFWICVVRKRLFLFNTTDPRQFGDWGIACHTSYHMMLEFESNKHAESSNVEIGKSSLRWCPFHTLNFQITLVFYSLNISQFKVEL